MNTKDVIEYDFRQRGFDGKWERLAKVKDYTNSYTYKSETGQMITHTPEKWLTVGVYDLLGEIDG
jgi:hypothetical protein